MAGNHSVGVKSECASCAESFTKSGQNNKYCSDKCAKTVSSSLSAKYSRGYQERYPGRRLVQVAKQRAKVRDVEFNLSVEEVDVPELCPILKIPLKLGVGQGGKPNSPSLDRIDNSKGYIDGNVQVISHLANSMKGAATRDQLLKFAKWIIENKDKL